MENCVVSLVLEYNPWGRTIRSPGRGGGGGGQLPKKKIVQGKIVRKKNHAKVRPLRKIPGLAKTNLAAPKLPKKKILHKIKGLYELCHPISPMPLPSLFVRHICLSLEREKLNQNMLISDA